MLHHSELLPALERGEPIRLPNWCHHLGRPEFPALGAALPGLAEAIAELRGEHGKWAALMVHANDALVPTRRT